jgi:hypothetical protein
MYLLMKMKLERGRRLRCVVSHVHRDDADVSALAPDGIEVLEDKTIPEPDGPQERERGWVVPVNPKPGDELRFEMVEVEPMGERGAAYEWEVMMCDMYGPARVPDPRVFHVRVPMQTTPDLEQCPGAEVTAVRASKDGERAFCWRVL